MHVHISTVERAFQLAASGRYATVTEIRSRLAHEGYRDEQVQGPLLAKQPHGPYNEDPGGSTRRRDRQLPEQRQRCATSPSTGPA